MSVTELIQKLQSFQRQPAADDPEVIIDFRGEELEVFEVVLGGPSQSPDDEFQQVCILAQRKPA